MDPELLPLLLAAANDEAPIEGRTRLQKMVFRVQQELPSAIDGSGFRFVPYDYGPFSRELAETITELVAAGKLREAQQTLENGERVKYEYELTPAGRATVNEALRRRDANPLRFVERVKREYNRMALPAVLDEIYSEYPEYATESNR